MDDRPAIKALGETATAFGDEIEEGRLWMYLEDLKGYSPLEWEEAARTVRRDELRFPPIARWREHLMAAQRISQLRDYHEPREVEPPELEPLAPRCPICERPDEVEKLDRAIKGRGWSCGRCRLAFSGSQQERLAQAERRAAYVHVEEPELPAMSKADVKALLADMRQIVRRA